LTTSQVVNSTRNSRWVAFVALHDARAEALAGALAAEGATVVLMADDPASAGRVAAAIGEGATVFCTSDDVGADVEALVELATDLGHRHP